MALTRLQSHVCRLLAERRRAEGEGYLAGGTALNALLEGARVSRDIDRFHDTAEAVRIASEADRAQLVEEGFEVVPVRERRGFVEVVVRERSGEAVSVEWVEESAFRFFPLVHHDTLGFTLHPIDLATNKTLALVGRIEVRDWVDILTCHERLTPFGCLAWAACGKDAGLGPGFVLAQASRSARYSASEFATLAFEGPAPELADLSRQWRAALDDAQRITATLPPDRVGTVVLDGDVPFRGDAAALVRAVDEGRVRYHEGSIGGAWPNVRPVPV